MPVREVKVEYGKTVNLGNYESERVMVGLAEDLGPDDLDDPGAALRVAHVLLDRARDIAQARLQLYEAERRLSREGLP